MRAKLEAMIKKSPALLALAVTAFLLASCNKPAAHDPLAADHPEDCPECSHKALGVEVIELFDGKTLEGWSHLLVDKSLTKEDVWSVRDGVLICKGQPLGYLHTDAEYQDFVLNLEWRWAPGTEPTNSGVLLRIAAEPETFLPQCVESQLKHGSAGDLYGFFGAKLEGEPERYQLIESEKIGTFHAVKKIKDLELPAGEWNHMRVKVLGDTVKVHINGELANEGKDIDVLAGPIGLQSEGGEIHFRNVRLEPLTAE